jgi:hypothetical protein
MDLVWFVLEDFFSFLLNRFLSINSVSAKFFLIFYYYYFCLWDLIEARGCFEDCNGHEMVLWF